MQPYKAHCFSGHSPICQVESKRKLRMLQAKSKAAKTILNRFAQIYGNEKNSKLKAAKKLKNLPACPKFDPAASQPVMVQCLLSIITKGCALL